MPDSHIRSKPFYFRFIPGLRGELANAIYPYIFVSRQTFKDLCSENPSLRSLATVIHEKVHFKRQKEVGIGIYALKYLFSRTFRFNEELLAIHEQMIYLKRVGLDFDIEKRAQELSGATYFWVISYDIARKELEKLWKNA